MVCFQITEFLLFLRYVLRFICAIIYLIEGLVRCKFKRLSQFGKIEGLCLMGKVNEQLSFRIIKRCRTTTLDNAEVVYMR